ncbi:MAG: GGDEF domain-containing protein [Burkholderiales bacterium]|nr:GGDEF domain-containing protein [Burkholderiales bacterium]
MRNISTETINGTQQQFKLLAASNACLRRNLIRFSHKIKQESLLAYHDELTGLPNRNLLLDRLHQAMQQAARQHKQVLLMYIDLDRFKWINEQLGHVAGNSLLQQVAMRLAINIRGADTACRYGGDEFIVMMPEIEGQHSIIAALNKIRTQLAVPYVIDDQVITLTASVGAAIYRGDEQSCEDLIRQAEVDMVHAKANINPPTIAVI